MSEGKEYTLRSLLEDEKYTLVMPSYQRSYAQGRDNHRDNIVLDLFINNITDVLTSEEGKKLSLDYVYGNIRESDGVSILFPVDGQQRLTTLFLFYVCCLKDKKDEEKEFLKKFRYEVHPETCAFLDLLIRNGFHEPGINEKNDGWNRWFSISASVHANPTAGAMLRAYRKIEEKLGPDAERYVARLENISFYLVDTRENHISESVFWRMNARGKGLTESEIFKAGIIKQLNEFDSGSAEAFNNAFTSFYETVFSEQENKDELKTVVAETDRLVMKTVKSFCRWFGDEKDFPLDRHVPSENYWQVLKENGRLACLVNFYRHYSEEVCNDALPARKKKEAGNILDKQSPEVIALCILFYRSRVNSENDNRLRQWMRVCLNLLDNNHYKPNLKKLVSWLCEKDPVNVYESILNLTEEEIDYAVEPNVSECYLIRSQVEEEKRKLRLFQDKTWVACIEEAENHEVLDGKIAVLLDIDGADSSPESFRTYFNCLSDLWSQCRENDVINGTRFTLSLLPYYEKDVPEQKIAVKFSSPEKAKDILYLSMPGTFAKYAISDRKTNSSAQEMPYWKRVLCSEDGERLVYEICVNDEGFITNYHYWLPVLWARSTCTWHCYGNLTLNRRNGYIAKLLTLKDGNNNPLFRLKYDYQVSAELPYFKEWFVLLEYKTKYIFRSEPEDEDCLVLVDEQKGEPVMNSDGEVVCRINISNSSPAEKDLDEQLKKLQV